MKQVVNFVKNESGAVTVDWVVLTAAIVGIAMAVIALISGGVEDASEGINGELEVASNFKFSFGSATAGTMSGYFEEYGDDVGAIYSAIDNDAPDGYAYLGEIDVATDTAIYHDMEGGTNNLSINGETVDSNEYFSGNPEIAGF
jgi:Flp pilus assembly pilin Flp